MVILEYFIWGIFMKGELWLEIRNDYIKKLSISEIEILTYKVYLLNLLASITIKCQILLT